jgi:hypothetical protein
MIFMPRAAGAQVVGEVTPAHVLRGCLSLGARTLVARPQPSREERAESGPEGVRIGGEGRAAPKRSDTARHDGTVAHGDAPLADLFSESGAAAEGVRLSV